ncbi:retropepsin-like aspartic protease [Myroides sp. LJL116]
MFFIKKLWLLFVLLPLLSLAQRIEIPYDDQAGWMLIKLKVNDQDMNFIFDTGWDGIAIRKSLLQEYQSSSQINAVDANNVVQEVETLKVKSIKVGNYTFFNLHFTNLEDFPMLEDPIFDCYKIDGILGNSIYRDRVLEIDPIAKKIILQDPSKELMDKLIDDGFMAINNANRTQQNRIVLPMNLAGGRVDMLFDTGDTGYLSLGVNKEIVSFLSDQKFNKYLSVGSVGAFGIDDKLAQSFIASDLQVGLGSLVMENQEVTFMANNFVSQVGVEFIKQFHLVYLPSINRVYLKRLTHLPKSVSTLERIGFGIAFYNGYYTIAGIGEGQQDYQLGDIVLAINGIPLAELCNYRMYLRSLKQRPVITLFRNGQELEI